MPIKPVLIISGASGAGKSTLLNRLIAKYPGVFGYSVSHTTRKPRSEEVNGTHYNFVSVSEFHQLEAEGEFVETSEFAGNLYGTTFGAMRSVENKNLICILDLEVNGIKAMKEKGIPGKYVFVKPPSMKDLEVRLRSKNDDSDELIAKRLEAAKEAFDYASISGSYDLIVVNDSQDTAFAMLEHYVEQVWKLHKD
jgi:guanylate kinase